MTNQRDVTVASPGAGSSSIWRHLRLGQKVTLAVFASFLPLLFLGIQVANYSGSLVKNQTLNNLGLVSQVEARRVQGNVESITEDMDAVLRSNLVTQALLNQSDANQVAGSNEQIRLLLAETAAEFEPQGMMGIELQVAGGTTERAGVALSQQTQGLGAVLGTSEMVIAPVYFVEGQPRLAIAQRLLTAAEQASIASSSLNASGVNAAATDQPTPSGPGIGATLITEWDLLEVLGTGLDADELGETMILEAREDGSHQIIFSTAESRLGDLMDLTGNPSVGASAVHEVAGFDGDPAIQASARVDQFKWITVLEADPDQIFQDLDRIRILQAAVFVGAGLVIIGVLVAALRSFVRRLATVTDLAEAIADGDLTVRTGDNRLDELGRLSMAFDDMAEALAHDIARRERVEAQLAYQATHDALTGLPNRQQLVEELDRMLVDSEELVSVLFVDLDGFKAVNDRLGHGAGDELLVRVGDRLKSVLRQGDFVARLGGDEFVVVLRGLGLLEAERMAERIVAALELPFIVSDDECNVSASIGVSSANDERSSERLMKEADIAMYRAKALGKGRAVRVTPEAMSEVDERISVLGELREAVSNKQFQLMLWPIGDLRSGALIGMEASVRWHHPVRGILTPADFLPLAMNSGFAAQIDEWVIGACIEQMADWMADGLPVHDLELAFNLTAEMFLAPRSRQMISAELARYKLRPSNFRVEVPESVMRSDGTLLREVFDTFRALGLPVTLDRFGSDYSNLDRLPRFAIDAVKIDLGLIADLSNRLSSRALVSSLITLAQTAGLRVTAAGIDDDLLRTELVELGCVVGQGMWLSPPLNTDEFADLVRTRYLLEAG